MTRLQKMSVTMLAAAIRKPRGLLCGLRGLLLRAQVGPRLSERIAGSTTAPTIRP